MVSHHLDNGSAPVQFPRASFDHVQRDLQAALSLDLPLYPSAMSSCEEQIPPHQKGQYTEAGLLFDHSSESPLSKQLKPSIKLHSAEFYSSLSKVWLTRRALKELHQRTRRVNSLQPPAPPPQRVHLKESSLGSKLKRFARHGGPGLCDLRGCPVPAEFDPTFTTSFKRSSPSKRSKSPSPTNNPTPISERSSMYDENFEGHLIDHQIYPKGYCYAGSRRPPNPDLEELYQRLAQPRPSLSPSNFSDSAFRDFEQKSDESVSERAVMATVVPIISGNVTKIRNDRNRLFTRLKPIANNTTVQAKPGFYDGACLEDIHKQVLEELNPYVVPTGHAMAPVAPNFFMEVKAPKGGADVAKRQACYNGAIGARAMHSFQSYSEGKPVYDGNAYTATATYHDGLLRIYATHPTRGDNEISPEYHMNQVKGYVLTNDPESFRQGATAFRNVRDWAKEQRDALITAANERARSAAGHVHTLSDSNGPVVESESSAGAGCLRTESSTSDSSTYNGPSDTHPA